MGCANGYIQAEVGQQGCEECRDTLTTSNEEHTDCVDDESLFSKSIVVYMIEDGVGLAISFVIALVFSIITGIIYQLRGKYIVADDACGVDLAILELRKVVFKSALPGFSFCSEVILIMGIWTENEGLAVTMLLFRLLHPITVLVLYITWFRPTQVPEYVRKLLQSAVLHEKFILKNIAPMCALLLASMCDATLVQMLPWENSTFYTESQGYPSLELMTVCLVVKSVQAFVSVICQVVYMLQTSDMNSPTTSLEAEALFGLSITLSVITTCMGLMNFYLKSSLLNKTDTSDKPSEMEMEVEMEMEMDGRAGRRTSTAVELEDLYSNRDEVKVTLSIENPLHNEMTNIMRDLRCANEMQMDQLKQKDEEIRQLRAQLGEDATESHSMSDI